MNVQQYVQTLLEAGRLEDQTGELKEKHKQTNLLLNCTEEVEQALEPLFYKILSLIESERRQAATSQGRRYYAPNASKYLPVIKSLVLNAIQTNQADYQNLHLSISRNGNDYVKTSRYALRNNSYQVMMAAFDCMVENNFLEIQRKGFLDRQTGIGERTRYHGTQTLFDAVIAAVGAEQINLRTDYTLASRPIETIRLKDPNKRLAEYEDTDFTNHARLNLSEINRLLLNANLGINLTEEELQEMLWKMRSHKERETDSDSANLVDFSATMLHRVFNDGSFSKGGRFYGGWWQGIPKFYRKHITINGKATLELDFTAMHPTMLYAEKGLTLGETDPYDIHDEVERMHGKTAFNALLNAKQMPTTVPEDFPVNKISWGAFLVLMMQRHTPIADRFLTGYGLNLQFMDSEIAEAIMLHFAQQGIPCLPVHDSFIVDADYKPELKIMMESLFQDRFGCPINVK